MLITASGCSESIFATRFFISDVFSFVAFASARFLSSVRVITTRIFCFSKLFLSFKAIARFTSFSFVPATPILPGSFPPCPLSIQMQYRAFCTLRFMTSYCTTRGTRMAATTRQTNNAVTPILFFTQKYPNICNLTYNVFGYLLHYY